jgi:hypothetical protein
MPRSKRYKNLVQVFVYRKEQLITPLSPDSDEPSLKIVEISRRNWRVAEGDVLLFTEGRGLSLRFVGFSEVIEVEREQLQEEGVALSRVTVTVRQPSPLPEDSRLSRFMYSLTIVSNFWRPWLHLRHRSRLPAVDFERLQQQRIVWDRTVFFGLLRELPSKWREFLEHESRALRARSSIRESWFLSERLDGEPVRELLTLVETTLLSPARLAADLRSRWEEVFGAESIQTIQVVTPEGVPEAWDMVKLLRQPTRRGEAVEGGWSQLADLNFERDFEGGLPPWRPHRW